MLLEEILLEENATIKDAIEKLEMVRCKVVYIVHNKKLKASISDGDIRRFVLHEENIHAPVKCIANKSPKFFYESQTEEIQRFFEECEAWSAPIINFNGEIIAVAFRNGQVVKNRNIASCPVVIMAGGKGTRLYPYTKILPKALIPVGDIPISEIIINSFKSYGCEAFHMIVNHKKDMIKAYFEANKSHGVHFYEEGKMLGTGGGLYLLKGTLKEDFFFTNCDVLIDADYSTMYQVHKNHHNAITIIAAEYTNSIPYGVIDMDEEHHYKKMDEKPSKKYYINTGLYILNPKVLELIPENEEISFPEIINLAKDTKMQVGVYTVAESAYMDMGQLEELDKMQRKLSL